jgi:hypothetical protein
MSLGTFTDWIVNRKYKARERPPGWKITAQSPACYSMSYCSPIKIRARLFSWVQPDYEAREAARSTRLLIFRMLNWSLIYPKFGRAIMEDKSVLARQISSSGVWARALKQMLGTIFGVRGMVHFGRLLAQRKTTLTSQFYL